MTELKHPTPNGSSESLSLSLVNILLAIHSDLGAVKAVTLGNRQVLAERMTDLKDHLNTRLDDFKGEVFSRFTRTDATLEAQDERMRQVEAKKDGKTTSSFLAQVLKRLPWHKVAPTVLAAVIIASMHLFPAEINGRMVAFLEWLKPAH